MSHKQIEKEARRVVEAGEADQKSQQKGNQGDNRTPDETIGQVKYADNGGGGEPKKQGGSPEPLSNPRSRAALGDS